MMREAGMQVKITGTDFFDLAEEIAASGKEFCLISTGTSMHPFIQNGDLVLISPITGRVEAGDVVLLKNPAKRVLLHRVIRRKEQGVVTAGDSSDNDDGFIPFEYLIGKVIGVSGRGYNFHLKAPFKHLIARRVIFSRFVCRYSPVLWIGKKIARILG